MGKLICIIVMAFGAVVMVGSFPPALAEILQPASVLAQHNESYHNMFNEANQIKFLIGGLALLFGGNMWWLRRYIINSEKKEIAQDGKIDKVQSQIDGLEGEHRVAMQFNGCAADPNAIRGMLEDMLKPLFDHHLHKRVKDEQEHPTLFTE